MSGAVSAQQIQQSVQQALQIELAKIDLVRDEKTAMEDKKLAYNNIDSAIESLEDSLLTLTRESSFATRNASTSNESLVTASASTSAAKTSFTFSSINQLATSARVTTASSLELLSGTAPLLLSSGDINGGSLGDYDPNVTISSNDQSVSPLITSGTMTINDVSIDVSGNDTLYTILSKINNAGAGVTATFDEANELVRLSGTAVGANASLTFSSGNTGFFEALNLDSSLVAGTDKQKDQAFDDIGSGALSTVSTGFFNINNFTFEVNAATDSLQSIINRVNSSNAEAVMFFDEDTGKVTLTHEQTGEPLELSNDTSGFLDAIGLLDQAGDQNGTANSSTYLGDKAEFVMNGETIQKDSNLFTIGGVTFSLIGTTTTDNPSATVTVSTNPDSTVEHVNAFVGQFNATMSVLNNAINDEDGPLEGDSILRRMMTTIRTGVLGKIANPGQYDTLVDVGLSFNRGSDVFTLELDAEKLTEALDADETSVRQLFAYNNDSDGLFDDGGYAYTLREDLRDYTRTATGFFYKQIDQINDNMDRIALKIYSMEEDVIDQEQRLFKSIVNQVQALQKLQAQGQNATQINSVVMNSLSASASGVFAASTA